MKPKTVGCRMLALAAIVSACGVASAQPRPPECNRTAPFPTGPDVIVGDLSDMQYSGGTNGMHAFAVGTISCNIGTQNLLWVANNNQHPVIGQNMFRLKNGRFEQIGMSWLKHGFTALTQNLCSTCNGQGGAVLGVGCSDPYVASLNGSQGNLGPRWQVNPTTGVFTYPHAEPAYNGILPRRLQVADVDLVPAQNVGAQYFVEGQYVTADDAAAGHSANNASYRKVNLTYTSPTSVSYTWAGSTQCTKPAIQAWRDHGLGANTPDPNVTLVSVDIPGDGRFWIAAKVTDNNDGTWHYEYAIQNLTSERCAGGVRVPIVQGAFPENIGFHDAPYHSGDGIPTNPSQPNTTARDFSGADWANSFTTTQVRWATETFASNTNANALRWGTLYNFRFDTNAQPGTANPMVIELFKPGTGDNTFTEVSIPGIPVPTVFVPRNVRVVLDMASVPELIPPTVGTTIRATIFAGNDQVQPGSTRLFYRHSTNSADPFTSIAMTATGNPSEFQAEVPGANCGNFVSFYVQAEGTTSGAVTAPLAGAAGPVVRPVGVAADKSAQNFETDTGWASDPADTATAGRWVRGDPNGSLFNPGSGNVNIQPETAHGGSNCWFTGQGPIGGNVSAADVDGGTTTLFSPIVDLSNTLTARVEYWRWFISGISTQAREDPLVVDVSNDGGQTWSNIETVPASAGASQWNLAQAPISIPLTANMKFRFVARDTGTDQIVEAAIDDFIIKTTACVDLCPADWNGVNGVSVQDIFDFIGDYAGGNADFNGDSSTSVQDVFDFVDAYFTPC
ncbi:MAG: hypothetical protein IT438_11035 [Phycisphaerales bacterium]|nr:hypothetical protein [Phycisphaerales bacterium]